MPILSRPFNRISQMCVLVASLCTFSILGHGQNPKPKITLDEFFNSVSFPGLAVSPDGKSVVIETERADWDQQIFRKELWLYRTATGSLIQLTDSGQDSSPQWSPDGQWVAFLSERKSAESKDADAEDDEREGHDRDKHDKEKK